MMDDVSVEKSGNIKIKIGNDVCHSKPLGEPSGTHFIYRRTLINRPNWETGRVKKFVTCLRRNMLESKFFPTMDHYIIYSYK